MMCVGLIVEHSLWNVIVLHHVIMTIRFNPQITAAEFDLCNDVLRS